MRYPATYFDGKTARPWKVKVDIGRRSLTIHAKNGTRLANWPFRTLERVPPIGKKYPIRLRNRIDANARLTIDDKAFIDEIRKKIPKLFTDLQSYRRLAKVSLIAGMLTTLTVLSLYITIPRLAKPIAQALPPDLEMRLGENTWKSLSREWQVCEGQGLEDIDELVTLLTEDAGLETNIKVQVVESSLMNAFAIPGGRIIITDELLKFTRSPNELAGVVAHEIGHVVLKHPLEGMISQMGVVLFVNVLTGGSTTDLIGNFSASVAITAYTRDYETEADIYGLKLMENSRIATADYADLFKRFESSSVSEVDEDVLGFSDLLSTHPYAGDRAERAEATEVEKPIRVMTNTAWKRVKSLCADIEKQRLEAEQNERVDKPSS